MLRSHCEWPADFESVKQPLYLPQQNAGWRKETNALQDRTGVRLRMGLPNDKQDWLLWMQTILCGLRRLPG